MVRDFCGHGLGRLFHDEPNILHVGRKGEGAPLAPGHVLHRRADDQSRRAIGVKILSDGWTAVTRDRSLSAQFEHTVGVTETGVRDLHPFAARRAIRPTAPTPTMSPADRELAATERRFHYHGGIAKRLANRALHRRPGAAKRSPTTNCSNWFSFARSRAATSSRSPRRSSLASAPSPRRLRRSRRDWPKSRG